MIDPNITDEKGFTSDIGIRGQINNKVTFDASAYALYYNDKIGEYETTNPNGSAAIVRYRANIGTAITYGFEAMLDWSVSKTFFEENEAFVWNVFSNVALTDSEYLKSEAPNIEGNKVEFIFEGIHLPFDDANNDGYVAFKIKTKPNQFCGFVI